VFSPLLSIVMATYNGEKFLAQQLDSIFAQTFQDFILIICDDASSDNTVQIIHNYIKNFSSIDLYENISSLGVVQNFKKGISLTQTPYIALCDQDDIWETNKLEILLKEMYFLELSFKNIPLMVHSDLSLINENNQLVADSFFDFKSYKFKEDKDITQMLGRCGVMGNTILMNSLLKEKALVLIDYVKVHDYTIALLAEIYGKRKTLYLPLVKYRIHNSNVSNSIKRVEKHYRFSFSSLYEINTKLPYRNEGRELLLEKLLLDDKITLEDKNKIKIFLSYLYLEANSIVIFYRLMKENFVRKGIFYRSKLLLRLFLKNRLLNSVF